MIQASIASLPERHQSLMETVDSLLPQVDALYVRRDTDGIGDAGKFTVTRGDYIFRCDDDLIYPDNYVETMINKIEHYNRGAVVSCHGKVLKRQPIESYYGSDFRKYHCLLDVERDRRVHIVGTGVLAYHRSAVSVSAVDFPEKNMADIWFSVWCEQRDVPRVCIEHPAGWIRHSDKTDKDETCWEWNKERDGLLTEAVNSIKWGEL